MQKVLVCSEKGSKVLYRGDEVEKARKLVSGTRGRTTLRIYRIIESETGKMELSTEEYNYGKHLCTSTSTLEDIVMMNIIFKLENKPVSQAQPQGR